MTSTPSLPTYREENSPRYQGLTCTGMGMHGLHGLSGENRFRQWSLKQWISWCARLLTHVGPVQVDSVVGDRTPCLDDIKQLRLTTRVINEAMRLYPQPPVLIRRASEDDVLGGFHVAAGSDIFISVWNIHRFVWMALIEVLIVH